MSAEPVHRAWRALRRPAASRHCRRACRPRPPGAARPGRAPPGSRRDTSTGAAPAAKLRAQPHVPWSRDAARMLEFMRHLCASPGWTVRVETVSVTGYYELVAGVLAGVITPDEAVRAARGRGGTEADVRRAL